MAPKRIIYYRAVLFHVIMNGKIAVVTLLFTAVLLLSGCGSWSGGPINNNGECEAGETYLTDYGCPKLPVGDDDSGTDTDDDTETGTGNETAGFTCVDTDKANDPTKKGVVRILTSNGEVYSTTPDKCVVDPQNPEIGEITMEEYPRIGKTASGVKVTRTTYFQRMPPPSGGPEAQNGLTEEQVCNEDGIHVDPGKETMCPKDTFCKYERTYGEAPEPARCIPVSCKQEGNKSAYGESPASYKDPYDGTRFRVSKRIANAGMVVVTDSEGFELLREPVLGSCSGDLSAPSEGAAGGKATKMITQLSCLKDGRAGNFSADIPHQYIRTLDYLCPQYAPYCITKGVMTDSATRDLKPIFTDGSTAACVQLCTNRPMYKDDPELNCSGISKTTGVKHICNDNSDFWTLWYLSGICVPTGEKYTEQPKASASPTPAPDPNAPKPKAKFTFEGALNSKKELKSDIWSGALPDIPNQSDRAVFYGNAGIVYDEKRKSNVVEFRQPGSYLVINDLESRFDDEYTVAFWARPEKQGSQNMFVKTDASGPEKRVHENARIGTNGNFEHYTWGYDTGSVIASAPEGTKIKPGEWQLVTISAKAKGEAKIYIDGKLVDTKKTGNMWSEGDRYYIGSNSAFSDYFTGRIDDIHIYPMQISDGDVAKIYNETKRP